MGFITTLVYAIFWGTLGYAFVYFLAATGMIPGGGGLLLSGMGYLLLVALAFFELETIKL